MLLNSTLHPRGKQGIQRGILKREVSLYLWPPVWLVWNQLYDNWQFLFLFAKQSNRRSTVQWYFPFSVPWSSWWWYLVLFNFQSSMILAVKTGGLHYKNMMIVNDDCHEWCLYQGILNGEVSLYHWPPVWLVWICLFCKWKQQLSFVI